MATADAAVGALDADFEDAIDAADAAYSTAIASYQEARDDAYDAWQMDPENTELEDAYNDAQAALDAAIETAEEQRAEDYDAAQTAYDDGRADADADYEAVYEPAAADLEAALADPDADYAAVNDPAWADYLDAVTDADDAYIAAEAAAWATYAAAIDDIATDLAATEADIVSTFDDAKATALDDWETAEAAAWSTYTTAMAALPGSPELEDRIESPAPVEDAGPGETPVLLETQEPVLLQAMQYTVASEFDAGQRTLRAGIAGAGATRPLQINFELPAGATRIRLRSELTVAADRHITITGPGGGVTLIRASTTAFRILQNNQGATAAMSNLTLRNGFALGIATNGFGGAIDNLGTLTLNNVTVSSNRAATTGVQPARGGAIYNRPSAILNVSGGAFYGNRAVGGDGGAIYNDASTDNGTIAHTAQLIIENGTYFEHNWANRGGAIYNHAAPADPGVDGRADVSIGSGVVFQFNHAIGIPSGSGRGGAIFNLGFVSATNAYFAYNTSVNEGGVLFNSSLASQFDGRTLFDNCTLENNEAKSVNRGKGGAIYVRAGIVRLVANSNNTIRGNVAGLLGRGIAQAAGAGTTATFDWTPAGNSVALDHFPVDDFNPGPVQ